MTDNPLIARADAAIRESERLRLETQARFQAAQHEIGRHQRAIVEMNRLFPAARGANLTRLPPRQHEEPEDQRIAS